jgi:hypothetical protein
MGSSITATQTQQEGLLVAVGAEIAGRQSKKKEPDGSTGHCGRMAVSNHNCSEKSSVFHKEVRTHAPQRSTQIENHGPAQITTMPQGLTQGRSIGRRVEERCANHARTLFRYVLRYVASQLLRTTQHVCGGASRAPARPRRSWRPPRSDPAHQTVVATAPQSDQTAEISSLVARPVLCVGQVGNLSYIFSSTPRSCAPRLHGPQGSVPHLAAFQMP